MAKQKRLHATPVSRIVSVETRALVGWVYRWNNGDLQTALMKGCGTHVLYELTEEPGGESAMPPTAAGTGEHPKAQL